MQNVDSKIIIAIALVLGVAVGFYADSFLFSGPKIRSLDESIIEQNSTINNLYTQLNELQNQHNTLQELYNKLDYDSSQEIDQNRIEIESLESQIDVLIDTIDDRDISIGNLQEQLETINLEYDKLSQEYESIYNPLEISYTVNNLKITLKTNSDKYPGNTAITGTLNIYYSDGTPYEGTYKLNLYKLYINSSSQSEEYNINGVSSYSWNTPFVQGSGSYKLSVSDLKDSAGNEIISNTELRNHVIFLFMG